MALSGVDIVLAILELQIQNATSRMRKVIKYKCVGATAMTLVAMQRALGRNDDTYLAIPFVTGVHDNACLYVTRFESLGSHSPIVIEKLHDISFNDATPQSSRNKKRFLATLAVLLSRIVRVANEHRGDLRRIMAVEGPELKGIANLFGTTAEYNYNARLDQTFIGHNGDSNRVPRNDKTMRDPSYREKEACRVASREGQIQQLDFPWPKPLFVEMDNEELMQWYQQESPFLFRGSYRQGHCSTSVFCKVWREGDRRTNRKAIANEVQFCKLARSGEVPTPRVLETLTCMDIDHVVASGGGEADSFTYHVLVTELHVDYIVRASDLVSFALSLITAVKKLHAIGILHCDIKPDNIIWDPATKVVRLVDFGHAQTIEKAVSYQTTAKYQAPEVVNGKSPHSVSSDTFSIGQTILDEFNRLDEVGQIGHPTADNSNVSALHSVREVALLLTQESAMNRISLEEAESRLQSIVSPALGERR